MGKIADYYRTWEQDEPNMDWYVDTGTTWVTGKGKHIHLKDMTTSHIINTIRAWEGLGKTKPPKGWCGGKMKWLDLLTKELLKRNDNRR